VWAGHSDPGVSDQMVEAVNESPLPTVASASRSEHAVWRASC